MGMVVDQRGGLSPSLDYFRRKRLEEFRPDMQFSRQRSWFPITTFAFDWNQPHYWLGTPGNDDFFAATGSFNQARQLGFRPMNGDGFHAGSL
jgi:hypothetical protein